MKGTLKYLTGIWYIQDDEGINYRLEQRQADVINDYEIYVDGEVVEYTLGDYAKIVPFLYTNKPNHEISMDNFDKYRYKKLETIVKLLAKQWYYGGWQWESPNERVQQMLMVELGYFPFKDEDEMIHHTQIDDNLYKEALTVKGWKELPKEIVPTIPEQFNAEIDDIIKNDTSVQVLYKCCGMEECICEGKEYDEVQEWFKSEFGDDNGLTPDEEIIKDLHQEKKQNAIDFAKWLAKEWMSMWVEDKWLWENVSVETEDKKLWKGYYTEEQLYEIYLKSL